MAIKIPVKQLFYDELKKKACELKFRFTKVAKKDFPVKCFKLTFGLSYKHRQKKSGDDYHQNLCRQALCRDSDKR